ncbi:unnamed protein product, partial [Chrysoparadoxa australica]
MVSFGNLHHNCSMIMAFWDAASTGDNGFSWLPQYHDLGLIYMTIAPFYAGRTMRYMSPTTFLRKPLLWLQLMSDHHCEWTAAPDFAYRLVTRSHPNQNRLVECGTSPPSFNLACIGEFHSMAEPIRTSTIDNFEDKFTPFGLRRNWFLSAYGLAESVVAVCWMKGRHLASSNPSLVCVGDTSTFHGTMDIRVVDVEGNAEVEEGSPGELLISSPSNALGYYGKPKLSEETFGARLQGVTPGAEERLYLRTGDLAFFEQGKLYICGRLKDLIICRGRNIYPQDVEFAAQEASPAVRPGCVAAFSANDEHGVDELEVVFEIRAAHEEQAVAVIQGVHASVLAACGAGASRLTAIRERTIPKTTSGKIRRRAARTALRDGTLAVVRSEQFDASAYETETALPAGQLETSLEGKRSDSGMLGLAVSRSQRLEFLEEMLLQVSSEVLLEPHDLAAEGAMEAILDRPLMEAGFNSVKLMELLGRLQQKVEVYGLQVPSTVLFDHPTLRELARYVEGFSGLAINASGTTIIPGGHLAGPADVVELHESSASAIVSMACRFCGGCNSPSQFWENLAAGVNGVKEIPHDRWDVDAYYDGDPGAPGKTYARAGGFIEDIDLFDNSFFGISSAEAQGMDPQQRLLLEVGYEALYKAGYSKASLSGSSTGVFVGACMNDWNQLMAGSSDGIGTYTGTGGAPSILANRVSYTLGLHGPSMAVDTACSSSLVALDLAVQSLQRGGCTAALVIGVNLMLSPATFEVFSKTRMLSPEGRCATFDEAADGYARGEGCGAILLKRTDLVDIDDTVMAVVRGSTVTHNGRSATFTAPNGISQQMAIHQALLQAGVASHEVSYVEAHGTGTALGDPIEVGALKAVYGEDRDEDCPLVVGAVKTNIGHLEGAAGIAGLIKAVLVLQHQASPSNLHFSKLNPAIDVEGFPVVFPCEGGLTPLKGSGSLAGVSSFGFGGANAHVILERGSALSQTTHDSAINELFSSRQRFPWREPSHALLQHCEVKEVYGDHVTSYSCEFGPRLRRLFAEYKLNGVGFVPKAAILAAAAGAVARSDSAPLAILDDVFFEGHMPLMGDEGTHKASSMELAILLGKKRSFEVYYSGDDYALIARGNIASAPSHDPATTLEPVASVEARCPTTIAVGQFYKCLRDIGCEYGSKFMRASTLLLGEGESLMHVMCFEPTACEDWEMSGFQGLHPAALQAAVQSVALLNMTADGKMGIYLLARIGSMWMDTTRKEESVWVHTRRARSSFSRETVSIRIFDAAGTRLVGAMSDVVFRHGEDHQLPVSAREESSPLYSLEWEVAEASAVSEISSVSEDESWLLLGLDNSPVRNTVMGVVHAFCHTVAGMGMDCQLLNEWLEEKKWRRVIYVYDYEQPLDAAIQSVLALVQCVAAMRTNLQPSMHFITQGMHTLGGHKNAQQAPSGVLAWQQSWVVGFLRSARMEHPGLRLQHIDLEISDSLTDLLQAVQLHSCNWPLEPEAAVRGALWYVPRLVQSTIDCSQQASLNLTPEATYIISGGLGGLGLLLALRMVKVEGARHVLLLSRSGRVKEGVGKLWQQLQDASGSDVRAISCDVSDAANLRQVIERELAGLPPVRGVVHAAGIMESCPVAGQSVEHFKQVFCAKVEGGWNLHNLSKQMSWPLDFFVCYSSLSSILGDRNRSSYAAANSALDGLVRLRRAEALPALSIQWGPWLGVGMAAEAMAVSSAADSGMVGVSVELSDAVLGSIWQSHESAVIVADVDWSRFRSLLHTAGALLTRLVPPMSKTSRLKPSAELLKEVAGMSAEQRMQHMTSLILGIAETVLDNGGSMDAEQPLMEAGMDSLVLVEYASRLQQCLGVGSSALPPTVLFNYPSAALLAGYFESTLFNSSSRHERTQFQWKSDGPQNVGPLAIVSIACRLPGKSNSLDTFWGLLEAGTSTAVEVPQSRWDVDAFFDPNPDAAGKTYARQGCFIEDADMFDNQAFGIAAAEVEKMDPQQRLLLEVGFEALVGAGHSKVELSGQSIGVFVGVCTNDWAHIRGLDRSVGSYTVTGGSTSLISNRVSYVLGLTGPCMSIDTACSSSLVALHSAILSLQAGECSSALVAGVNLLLSPYSFEACTKARMLSPEGRCAVFDESANGYVRGEGCGAMLLKRLEDVGDGEQVLAVVRGSAVTHNGRSASLTAPNGVSQQTAIRQALDKSGAAPHEVSYVEAHGTGTALGDPIEVGALKAVYGEDRDEDCPLVIGAVKTNIGHLEGAAGIAGLIKAVLVLQHQAAPSNLHFSKLNPAIDVEGFPVVFPCEAGLTPLEGSGSLAGVSSFGFGGANAHVVLERGTVGRSAPTVAQPKVAFLFTGQGSQYVGMGKGLYEAEPVYRRALDSCASILEAWLPCSLYDLMFGSDSISPDLIDRTECCQPALFSLEYSLSELWRSKGMVPDAVMGHSVGEVVAACVAGVMSLEDGLMFTVHRARSMQRVPRSDGCMYAVRAGAEEVSAAISNDELAVSIAAVNGPKSVTISGSEVQVQKVLSKLDGVVRKRLLVSHAFHSSLMQPAVPEVQSAAARISFSVPKVAMITNASGQAVSNEQVTSPEHWAGLVVKPVLFHGGMSSLVELGCTRFIEIGPSSTLLQAARSCLGGQSSCDYVSSLKKGEAASATFNAAAATLQAEQLERMSVSSKLYRNRKRFSWHEPSHLFLQHRSEDTIVGEAATVFTCSCGPRLQKLLQEHVIKSSVIFPGAGYIEAAAASVRSIFGSSRILLRKLKFLAPMYAKGVSVSDGASSNTSSADTFCRFETSYMRASGQIEIRKEQDHTLVAAGFGESMDTAAVAPTYERLDLIRSRCATATLGQTEFYKNLKKAGYEYGPQFQRVRRVEIGTDETVVCIDSSSFEEWEQAGFMLHPAVLSGAIQTVLTLGAGTGSIFLPSGVESVAIWGATQSRMLWAHTKLVSRSERKVTVDIHLVEPSSLVVVAELKGLTSIRSRSMEKPAPPSPVYTMEWEEI